jgi:hypothetical protein
MLISYSNPHYNKQKELIFKVMEIYNKHDSVVPDMNALYLYMYKGRNKDAFYRKRYYF